MSRHIPDSDTDFFSGTFAYRYEVVIITSRFIAVNAFSGDVQLPGLEID